MKKISVEIPRHRDEDGEAQLGQPRVTTAPSSDEVAGAIKQECTGLCSLLIAKNEHYGNSAFNPLRIFAKSDALEQLNVRIDDKLTRLARGMDGNEDTELDLIGYLILRRVARRLEKA